MIFLVYAHGHAPQHHPVPLYAASPPRYPRHAGPGAGYPLQSGVDRWSRNKKTGIAPGPLK